MDNKNEEASLFLKKYPLIFKKFRPIKKIGKGAFSIIFSGINIYTKEKVAIKIEKRKTIEKYLESECFLLFSLKGIGIPKVYSFGHNKEYDILIMPLLGRSIQNLYISKNKNFEFKDICLMAIQIIERIQWVHSQKIIHRDIKPDNFLIGLNDPNIIYLIDFGLSKKYRSSQTGKHIKYTEIRKFTGTVLYGSVNALKFREQSRRDDLESIGYMIIYLIRGSLPWMGIKVGNKKENYIKLSQIKKKIRPEKLCENLPVELIDYMKYVKELQFEENPDYSYLKFLFEKMLKKQGFEIDNLYFSWISESLFQRIKKPIDLAKRTSYSRERILNNIRKKLDAKRSLSEIRKINSFTNCIDSFENNNATNKRKIGDQLIKSNTKYENNNINNTPNINYINNSINNNFISISVSLQKSINTIRNNLNQNNRLKNNQNIKQLDINKICSDNEINEAVSEINYKLVNKNNKSKNTSRIYLEKNNRKNTENNNNNNNNIFYKNNVINNLKSVNYNNYNPNNYIKKYYSSEINNIISDNSKNLFEKNNNYNINNNNNNKYLYTKKVFRQSNNSKQINDTNNTIYNTYNLSYNNLDDINCKKNFCNQRNNIKIISKDIKDINESIIMKRKNLIKNIYHFKVKDKKISNLSPFAKKQKSAAVQKNINKKKSITNNELMNEIKRFNIKYNNKDVTTDKKLIQNRVKKALQPRMTQNNQSADHKKVKNLMYGARYYSHTKENNCIIT